MAGILDSKTRFIDMIVTQEGKRQISTGRLRAKYASISDDQTFYDPLEVDDVSNRIFFQSMGSHNEVIVLEKDDTLGGRARQFKIQGFTFDMGPSWYWMPEVFDQFWGLFWVGIVLVQTVGSQRE